MNVYDQPLTPAGYEQHTSISAAKPVQLKGATYLLLQAETQAIRWRDDGVAPTATVGMSLPPGQDFWYTGDPSKLQVIQATAGAILNVSGYK